jgi:hypothetical protein
MTLAFGVLIGLLAALIVGASWRGLTEVRWRLAPLCLLGLAVQLVLFSGSEALVAPLLPVAAELHVLSYLLVFVSLLANWRIPGIAVIIVGGLLNFAAIVANGGQMPRVVAPGPSVFNNVQAMDENTRLVVLSDFIPIPFLGRLISIGDILITAGGGITAYGLARAKRPDHSAPFVVGRFGNP